MSLVYAFLADGLEEIEGLAVVDVLRRAGVDIQTVSVTGSKNITGSHNIKLEADLLFDECNFAQSDMLFLPGGMPGTNTLKEHKGLEEQLLEFHKAGKKIAAICAAPSVLGELNILDGKRATCFPGFEDKLFGAVYTGEKFETDGNVTTARGMGVATEFALELVRVLVSSEKSDEVRRTIQM